MTGTDSGTSHEARDFFDWGDANGVFGEDSNAIAAKVRDQDVLVLWVDDNMVQIARILA